MTFAGVQFSVAGVTYGCLILTTTQDKFQLHAQFVSSSNIVFLFPPWPFAAQIANATLFENGQPVALQNGMIHSSLAIAATLIEVSPSLVSGLGGQEITISGYGFNVENSPLYAVLLQDEALQSIKCTGCQVISPYEIICRTPLWTYYSAPTHLEIMKQLQSIGSLQFGIFTLLQYGPVPERALAGTPTFLILYGVGFNNSEYSCIFQPLVSDGAVVLVTAVTVLNASALMCLSPYWNQNGGTVKIEVVDTLSGHNLDEESPFVLQIVAEISSFLPTTGPATGTIISIFGHGFSDLSSYSCAFSDDRSTPAMKISSSLLTCDIPAWIDSQSLIISVYDSIYGKVFSDRNLTFLYQFVLNPSVGQASGGEIISIFGCCFTSKYISFLFHL